MLGVLKSSLMLLVLSVLLVSCGGSDDPVPDTISPIVGATPASTGVNETKTLFSVDLNCTDTGGSGCKAIYFTINGDAPTLTSTEYTAAIDVPNTQTTVLKFIAVDMAGNKSVAVTETYTYDVTAPSITASVSGGTYSTIQQVDLTCTDETNGSGCEAIYYTLDGSVPSEASLRYTTTLSLDNSLTLRFIAYDAANNASMPGQEIYQFDFPSIVKMNFQNGSIVGVKHIFTVDFSKIIDLTTVSSTSFVVAEAGTTNSIAGTYDLVDKQLNFTPDTILDNASTYTVTLKVSIADLSGSTLQKETNAIVTTPGTPTTISGKTYGKSNQPSVYAYAAGSLMIWSETDGRSNKASVMFRFKLDSQATWSEPSVVPGSQSYWPIQVASNGAEVMLVERAGSTGAQYTRFSGSSWSPMQSIALPASVTYVGELFLASNLTQFSLVMSTSNQGAPDAFFYKNYNNNQWSVSEQKLESAIIREAKMTIGNSGILMTWANYSNQLYAAYNTFGAWGVAQQLPNQGSTIPIRVIDSAASATGFVLAWEEETVADPTLTNLMVSDIDLTSPTTSVWAAPKQITTIATQKYSLVFGLASNGNNVVLVWDEDSPVAPNTNSQHRVYSSEFIDSATGWSTANPLSIAYPTAYTAGSLQVLSNGTGYAVVWKQNITDSLGVNSADYRGVIHDGNNWQTVATIGSGSNVILGFNVARIYIVSNGQSYAAWWTDYTNSSSTGEGVKFTATVSLANNTWPASPEVLNNQANANYDDTLITTATGYNGLWYANDGNGLAFFNKEYTNAGWDAAESLYFVPTKEGASIAPSIAMNDNGVQVAVWLQYDLHLWNFYASTNSGSGWMPAKNISGCGFQTSTSDNKLDVMSNGTDFMIICEGLFRGGLGYRSDVRATPFNGTTFGTSISLGQRTDYNIASNNNYAIAYTGPGLTKSKGQTIREYDARTQQWLDAVIVYDTDSSISTPVIESNGTDYALAWHESININPQKEYQLTAAIYDRGNQAWNSNIITALISTRVVTPILTGYTPDSYTVSWGDRGSFNRIYNSSLGQWGDVTSTETDTMNSGAVLAMSENNGDLGLVWADSRGPVIVNTYTAGSWQQETVLTTNPATGSLMPARSIAANNSGYAVVWGKSNVDGTANIFTSRYRNGEWSLGYSINNGAADFNSETKILDVGTGFKALWTQRDPTHPTDKTTYRVVISEEY